LSLESNKSLGGIGAILLAIPFLNLIGIILVLIALKGMGEYYDDEEIFKNALYGFIFGFIGVIGLVACNNFPSCSTVSWICISYYRLNCTIRFLSDLSNIL